MVLRPPPPRPESRVTGWVTPESHRQPNDTEAPGMCPEQGCLYGQQGGEPAVAVKSLSPPAAVPLSVRLCEQRLWGARPACPRCPRGGGGL